MISIVIPTLNNTDGLKKCLMSVKRQRLNPRVIIIFDGSNQPDQQKIKRFCKKEGLKTKFIVSQQNKGFTYSVNQGIKKVKRGLVFLLNDDAVLAQDCLKKVEIFYQKNKHKKIYGQALVLQSGGEHIDTAGGKLLKHGQVEMVLIDRRKTEPQEIELVSATAAFYPRRFFNQVGFFDEKFGSYLEDVDISITANKLGWQGYVLPNAKVVHEGQATSKRRPVYKKWLDLKNWLLLIKKHPDVFEIKKNWLTIIIERLRNLSGLLKAFFQP